MRFVAILLLCLAATSASWAQSPATWRAFGVARPPIGPDELGLVVNEDDPLSVRIADYYREQRRVPQRNVVRVHLGAPSKALPAAELEPLKQQIDAGLDADVQVLALAWTMPYAVECMSITGALAFGFQPEICRRSCAPTPPNPYFDTATRRPYTDYGLRPAMLLAARTFDEAKALIDRGIAADRSAPAATAYLLDTSDTARNVRAALYPKPIRLKKPPLGVRVVKADRIEDRKDVMFYITGRMTVDKLETLKFLPGALADHLTSLGGDLIGGSQMSSLRWIEAGATASYGTVSEPCNHAQKFPHPAVLLRHYLSGETAVEAYWKSVLWPAQGLFIGEPLASPYRR